MNNFLNRFCVITVMLQRYGIGGFSSFSDDLIAQMLQRWFLTCKYIFLFSPVHIITFNEKQIPLHDILVAV